MAITSEQLDKLKQEFQDISEETRKAYDAWKSSPEGTGFGSSNSLYSQYVKAQKSGDKKEIARLKPLFEAAQEKYRVAQEKKNAKRKELAAAEKDFGKEKVKGAEVKSAQAIADKAIEDLKSAELTVEGYQGESKYVAAYQKAQAANDALVKAGGKPVVLPTPVRVIPPSGATDTTQGGTGGTGPTAPEATLTEIKNTLAANPTMLAQWQQNLAKFGYKGNTDGKWSIAFQNAFDSVVNTRATLPKALQGASLQEFIINPSISLGDIGTGAGKPTTKVYLTPETKAAGIIRSVIKDELGRDATATEISSLFKALNNYEKTKPVVYGDTTQSGGVDATEYIRGLVRGEEQLVGKSGTKIVPKLITEFGSKKGAADKLVAQDIMATIDANGLKNVIDQGQIDTYVNRIRNGEKVDTIKNEIRANAKRGMPESVQKLIDSGNDLNTIYAPYRKAMASILELDPNSITLNDPTLTNAIGPNGEMPLYEFQRALRKDPRWQYTDNAKTAVSESVQKILKDFGFMG